METSQSEITCPDLTKIAKNALKNHVFDINKNPNEENHFKPIPNQFYGFCIVVPEFEFPETIDVEHEDVTNQKLI